MQVQAEIKKGRGFVKGMPLALMNATFVLLAVTGCTNLPNRNVPDAVGVKQTSATYPAEYVFCDMRWGALVCEQSTPKTTTKKIVPKQEQDVPDSTTPMSDLVRCAIGDLVTGELSKAAKGKTTGTNPVPDMPPVSILSFAFDDSHNNGLGKIRLLDVLDKISGKKVGIHGDPGDVGRQKYNVHLGTRRANQVKKFRHCPIIFQRNQGLRA